MGEKEIHQIRTGAEIGDITFTNALGQRREVFTLCEGVLPDSVTPTTPSVHAFVARERAHGFEQAAVVVEKTEDGVQIDIEARSNEVLENPQHLQGLVQIALSECGIKKSAAVYAGVCPLPQQVLEQIGFRPDQSGEHLQFQVAA